MTDEDKVRGNEFVMNISQETWQERGDYWIELAEKRAKATKQEIAIVVDSRVCYRVERPRKGSK